MTMLPNRSSVTVVITDVSQGGHTGGSKKNATNMDLNGLVLKEKKKHQKMRNK